MGKRVKNVRNRDEAMCDDPTDRQTVAILTSMITITITKQTCAKTDLVNTTETIYQNNDDNCNTTALLASMPTIQMEIMAGIVQQLKNMKNKDFY